jgi:hypothetical protein
MRKVSERLHGSERRVGIELRARSSRESRRMSISMLVVHIVVCIPVDVNDQVAV